jgi:hypothetical protein
MSGDHEIFRDQKPTSMGWLFGVPALRGPLVEVGCAGTAELDGFAAEATVITICPEGAGGAALVEPIAEAGTTIAGAGAAAVVSAIGVVADEAEDAVIGRGRSRSQKAAAPPSASSPTAATTTIHVELFCGDRWSVTDEVMGADWLIPGDDTLCAAGGNVSGIVVWMLGREPIRIGAATVNGISAAASSLAEPNRRARSFSRQRRITASSPGGRSGRSSLGRIGSVWSTRAQSWVNVSAGKGTLPVIS